MIRPPAKEMTHKAAHAHLLAAYNLLAPTRDAQIAILDVMHELEDNSVNYEEITLCLAEALFDGLKNDGWPTRPFMRG